MVISVPLQNWIISQRRTGYSYAAIARACYINESTVRAFCNRHSIIPEPDKHPSAPLAPLPLCRQCGLPIIPSHGRKFRKFCSYKCQDAYWSNRRNSPMLLSLEILSCPICGKPFSAIPSHKRIYCSRNCYYISRAARKDKLAIPARKSDEYCCHDKQ